MGVVADLILMLALVVTVSGRLKCYNCDSVQHRSCGLNPVLSVTNISNIVECNGTCKIGALRTIKDGNQVTEVYIRMCDHEWTKTGYDSHDRGAVRHCDYDFCNYEISVPFPQRTRTAESSSTGGHIASLTPFVLGTITACVIYIVHG